MIRTKKQKIITLSIVFAAVLVLSIGFAVYSNSLYIKAKLSVNPNVSESYSVVFSTSATSVATGSVEPTVTGEATAEAATIDASTTLSALNVAFKSPGDSVTYTLYAYNNSTGITDPAYLTSIKFGDGSTFKVCTANTGTTQSTVDNACESINVTVTVGSDSATNTTTSITDHTLAVGASEKVTVTITYASDGAEADGAFEVEFGDISLYYSDGSTTSTNSWVLTDSNSNGEADVGEIVSYENEEFYVIETSNSVAYSEGNSTAVTLLSNKSSKASTYLVDSTSGTITLLAKYNIWVSSNDDIADYYPYQKSGDSGTIIFSSTNYWSSTVSSYPAYVYNSSSYLYPYVEKYKEYLVNKGLNVVSSSIPNYEQLVNLGCDPDECSCENAPLWVYSTDYWTGSAPSSDSVWYVDSDGHFDSNDYYPDYGYGVRPVITINASDLSS